MRQRADDVPRGAPPQAAAQKKLIHAAERDTERVQTARHAYAEEAVEFDLRRLKFVDESGVNISMTRLYGRAPRGERVFDSAPQNYGENVTMLGALSATGLCALMTVNGATDGEVFAAFVREVLAPTLRAETSSCSTTWVRIALRRRARRSRQEGRDLSSSRPTRRT